MSKLFNDLEKKIQENAQAYYTNGSQKISDEEFDTLVDRLRKENPDSEMLKVGWGYDVNLDNSGEKFKHKYGEADSLDKVYAGADLKPIFRNTALDCSLKLDGISIIMYFHDGVLYQALTRGDGTFGVDRTTKVKEILGDGFKVVNLVDCKGFNGAVRGEVIMSYDNFEEFRKLHINDDTLPSTPRNSVAGLLGMKEISSDLSFLDIVVYSIFGQDNLTDPNSNITYVRNLLKNNFNHVAPNVIITAEESFDSAMNNLKDCWYGVYPADGIVLTKLNVSVDSSGYFNYEHCAYKFPSEKKQTKVKNIEWNMSKTHYAVPRVEIEPIEVAGATIKYVTGYNAQFINDNKLGPGAVVVIERRGEVIPNIVEVISGGETFELPEICPVCGSSLRWDGVHLKCDNTDCDNATIQDTLIWLNTLVPRDKLGNTLILKFISMLRHNNILEDNSIESIMKLEPNEQILPSTILAQEFVKMLEDLHTKKFKLNEAIAALNIPRLGPKTCEKLSSYPSIVTRIMQCAISSDTIDLIDIYGTIGNANADAIVDNCRKFKRLYLIKDQIDWTSHKSSSVESKGSVAITGKLSVPRSIFEKELKAVGYEVKDINSSTLFLITDNPDSKSSKNIKADKYGVQKITESEFRSKFM